MTAPHRELFVEGDLSLDIGRDHFDIHAEGDAIAVDAESLGALRRLNNSAAAASGANAGEAAEIARTLLCERGGVRLIARVRGVDVAETTGRRGDRIRIRKWNTVKSLFGTGRRS